MKRREFLSGLAGAAAIPFIANAQQGDRIRRVGVIMAIEENDPQQKMRMTSLNDGLEDLGWVQGRNLQIDVRTGLGADTLRRNIAALIALAPDVLLTSGTASLGELLKATRTVPIVFVNAADPVGAGFIESLAQPGGNATGFTQFEYSLSGKWPELLKEIVPEVTRAAVLRDADITAGIGQFAVIQSVAPSLGLDVRPVNLRETAEIERSVTAFARSSNGGLIVTAGIAANVNRHQIIALAARFKLPAVYCERIFVTSGGLISYGTNSTDQFKQVAAYIDRVLNGQRPSDLPVQAPIKYELVINLKTAKELGLALPANLLARADEVIES